LPNWWLIAEEVTRFQRATALIEICSTPPVASSSTTPSVTMSWGFSEVSRKNG